MTQEEQISLLGLDKLNVLDRLKVLIPDFKIGGSISLIEYGVCKRKVQDIDIVVENFDLILRVAQSDIHIDYYFDYDSELQGKGTSVFFEKGKIPNQVRFKIYDIHVCVFLSTETDFKTCEYMGNRTFKVSHPRYAIEAKKRYLANLIERERTEPLDEYKLAKRVKHTADVIAYETIYPPVIEAVIEAVNSDLPF